MIAKETSGTALLPNGSTLHWELNGVGGRRYTSDEVGFGVLVWDTSLIDSGSLLIALAVEREHEITEARSLKRRD